ncbi:hypothetical protein GOP47_0025976, partial [Adiantum capillus-veneris]
MQPKRRRGRDTFEDVQALTERGDVAVSAPLALPKAPTSKITAPLLATSRPGSANSAFGANSKTAWSSFETAASLLHSPHSPTHSQAFYVLVVLDNYDTHIPA